MVESDTICDDESILYEGVSAPSFFLNKLMKVTSFDIIHTRTKT